MNNSGYFWLLTAGLLSVQLKQELRTDPFSTKNTSKDPVNIREKLQDWTLHKFMRNMTWVADKPLAQKAPNFA